jgi:hypothetical protein
VEDNMYKKLGFYKDNKNFGNQVIVYKGKQDYFVVIKDREETVYYFVDDNLEKIYPMNSYITKIGFVFREEINVIDCIKVDLSLYGHSNCPEYLRKIIQNIIKS